jgi:two-component system, OmpR family, KDP operon response regulator KdpE
VFSPLKRLGGILALLTLAVIEARVHAPEGEEMVADRSTCESANAAGGPAAPAGLSVVVVDDDTAWLADLETWLGHEGFHVIGISRGEWVLEAVDFHEPDVVVVDLQLPGIDGLEILGQLRRRRPALPVIVMTAFGGADIEQRVRRGGAAGYFDKPFRLENLVAAIRLIGRRAS